MKKIYLFSRKVILIVASLFLFLSANAQSENEAEWNGYGHSLKKVVSNTSIQSGITFSYTIMFSAPAGTNSINIIDEVPFSLGNVSVSPPAPVLGVTPTVSIVGNDVSYLLTGLPSGMAISGSFTITVQFPAGVTCNGTTARNRAGMLVNEKWHFTPYVSTVAEAESPWKITKTILNGAVVNPNTGSCGYLIPAGETVTYRIYVNKENGYWGNNIGQENMTSAVVTDLFPAGATFTSTCFSPSPGSGTGTWTIGTLDAANPYAFYYCDVSVTYPAATFPNGTTINNEALLTGEVCGQEENIMSNETCIEVADITPSPGAYFRKYLSLTNKVPGCQGYYRIIFCNNGNVALSPFNIEDIIPGGITVENVVVYGGDATTTMNLIADGTTTLGSGITTSSFNTGPLTSSPSSLELQMTGSLPVGECVYMYIYFTIDPNPTGTLVSNCAEFIPLTNALTLPETCVDFTVEAGEPKPCLIKDICNPQTSYDPGDIIRFRLRVQNIGSDHLVGASIQDVLNSSFTYIGNESYYTSSSYNPPCTSGTSLPSGAVPWSGIVTAHSGSTLEWSLPDIAADCQLFYNAYCGTYGTSSLPYYYIEFDVQVSNSALIGVTPNNYEISGGNLTSPVISNTVYTLIEASLGQEVYKEISVNNGANYTSSATTSAGSSAKYRLNYTNVSNVPVQELEMVDLLPRNENPDDWLVLNRSLPRGSEFDVNYVGLPMWTQLPSGSPTTPTIDFSTGLNICLPDYGITTGTTSCITSTWGSTTANNVRINWGTYSLDPMNTMQHAFDVEVSPDALLDEVACNDFAARSKAAFLLNGTPQLVALTPIASAPVCLEINALDDPDISCCDSLEFIPVANDDAADLTCCIVMRTKCEVKYVDVEITGGTIGAAAWSCGPLPAGFAGQSSFSFPANGCAADLKLCIDPDYSGPISITYFILFDNGERCERTVNLDCIPADINCCDSVDLVVKTEGDACCAVLTSDCNVKAVTVNVTNGVLSGTSWNCGTLSNGYVGQSTYTFMANGCPIEMTNCVEAQQSGPVYLDYVLYFENGDTCHQRTQLDCTIDKDCCENTKLVEAEGKDCCARLVSDCEVKSIDLEVSNGTISDVQWNCSTSPGSYAGLSSYTFSPGNCAIDMTTCVTPLSSGPVTLTYQIYYANGEKCEQVIDLNCAIEVPTECCALVDFKLKHIWPQWGNMAGTFNITNLDPSSPICGISINASPSATFSTGNLYVDGTLSSEPWTGTMIPTSGTLNTPAINDLSFTIMSSSYKGVIEICVLKCDGTKCCFEYKWNQKPWIEVELELAEKANNEKLSGTIVSPNIKDASDLGKIKYVSFGIADKENENAFFAISGSDLEGGEIIKDKAEIAATYMSRQNAFFELKEAKMADQSLGEFNLVFTGELPSLGCTLFDEDGNIVYTGVMKLTGTDTVHTSIESASLQASMFEVLKLYPNPNEGTFNINFALGEATDTEVQITSIDGRMTKSVVLERMNAGIHNVEIDLGDVAPGLYHVTLYSDKHKLSRSLIVK